MNIVVLDGYALNPGDLDWDLFEKLGLLTVYDRTPDDLILKRSRYANIILVNKTRLTKEVIDIVDGLQYIGELATGYDNIDISAAAARGIPVCNIPGYSTDSVAQHTFSLILEFASEVARRSEDARNGGWMNSEDFCYGHIGLVELKDKVLGLIGLGKIGSAVARIGHAFGMKVIANVRHPEKYDIPYVSMTSVEDVFESSDFVSLHCPLTEENKKMVNAGLIDTMKPTSFLVNTARGGLIDEVALADALNNDLIAGAGLDVLSAEPPRSGNPLLNAKNCYITPHVAWATKEARMRLMQIAADNIKGFLNKKPINVVNGVSI